MREAAGVWGGGCCQDSARVGVQNTLQDELQTELGHGRGQRQRRDTVHWKLCPCFLAAALSCFFCLYLSLRAGMLMFLAVTVSNHRQRIAEHVKWIQRCQNKSTLCQ